MNRETLQTLKDIIKEAETMKNTYFWQPPCNAGSRRNYEKLHSHDIISWQDGNDTYTAQYIVTCSCKNIYTQGIYTRNGKKTTLTAIRNSLKRIEKDMMTC